MKSDKKVVEKFDYKFLINSLIHFYPHKISYSEVVEFLYDNLLDQKLRVSYLLDSNDDERTVSIVSPLRDNTSGYRQAELKCTSLNREYIVSLVYETILNLYVHDTRESRDKYRLSSTLGNDLLEKLIKWKPRKQAVIEQSTFDEVYKMVGRLISEEEEFIIEIDKGDEDRIPGVVVLTEYRENSELRYEGVCCNCDHTSQLDLFRTLKKFSSKP